MTVTVRRRWRVGGWLALAGLTVAACAAGGPAATGTGSPTPSTPGSPTGTTVSSPPPASPSPSLPPVKQEAVDAAQDAIKRYFRVRDDVGHQPTVENLAAYEDVAIGTALNDARNAHILMMEDKVHQTGYTVVESMTNPRVDLTNRVQVTPPEVPTVMLDVCYDVSDVDLINAQGKSVVPPDRKPRGVERIRVYNYTYPDGPWKVGLVEMLKERTC